MQQLKIVLADSHRIFIEGIQKILERSVQNYQLEIIGSTHTAKQLLTLLNRYSVDLIIFDLNFSDMDGFDLLDQIHKEQLNCKKLVLTAYDDPKIIRAAFRKGIHAYILKNQPVEEVWDAIDSLMNGDNFIGKGVKTSTLGTRVNKKRSFSALADRFVKKHSLTKRELEILHLISQALSNKEIAKELFISDQTVSVHRKNIMRKLGVSNTAGLIKLAYDYSLV